MRERKVYQEIAALVDAIKNCQESHNTLWEERHREALHWIESQFLPHGAGFDTGTKVDLEKSTKNKLVLYTEFHHMDEWGFYDGWTSHTITIRPDLVSGYTFTISGSNRNDIKEYIGEVFWTSLNEICQRDYEWGYYDGDTHWHRKVFPWKE